MKSKKILHVITVSFVINHFFGKQFNYLADKSGNEFHLACSPSDDLFDLSKNLGFVSFTVEITREISPLKDLKAIVEIYRYIKLNKIDTVVGHTPKGGMIAMIASAMAGVRNRVYFRHGIMYETSTGLKRSLFKNIERLSGFFAKKVVCVSYSVEEISKKDKLNCSNKNVVLGLGTCNGIDTEDRFNPQSKNHEKIDELKRKFNITANNKVVGYVGRLVKDKGIDDLIKGWDVLKVNFPNARLLLVGPIEIRDSISDYSKNQILTDDSIIFTGFVPDASDYFALMNIFILPTYREGFPTVSLEASSMQLPVLITKATGCTESIIENETGLFVSNQPADITTKIMFYLENVDIALLHGKQGRAFVQKNFEQTIIWDLIAKKLNI